MGSTGIGWPCANGRQLLGVRQDRLVLCDQSLERMHLSVFHTPRDSKPHRYPRLVNKLRSLRSAARTFATPRHALCGIVA